MTALELWRNTIKHRKDETLYALYAFCEDFFTWVCLKSYLGDTCADCRHHDECQSYKLTMVEVRRELLRREFCENVNPGLLQDLPVNATEDSNPRLR